MTLYTPPPSRYRFGLLGEAIACLLLLCKGYQIVERRHRNFGGEIDVIAKRGRCLVFVEVKSRQCALQLAYAIPLRQTKTITRAAAVYLQQHPKFQEMDVRFDVIYISPYRWPEHLENAW